MMKKKMITKKRMQEIGDFLARKSSQPIAAKNKIGRELAKSAYTLVYNETLTDLRNELRPGVLESLQAGEIKKTLQKNPAILAIAKKTVESSQDYNDNMSELASELASDEFERRYNEMRADLSRQISDDIEARMYNEIGEFVRNNDMEAIARYLGIL